MLPFQRIQRFSESANTPEGTRQRRNVYRFIASSLNRSIAKSKLRSLTIFLHLLQPAARLWGRLRADLTPWRRPLSRGAEVQGSRGEGNISPPLPHSPAPLLSFPRPRTCRIWSKQWRAPETWLESIEAALRAQEEFKLFLKDFGFSQRSKDEPAQRRERELRVYRDLLAGTDLGTPTYYGSIWDESQGRFWLLLELVEGTVIKDHNVETGVMAAGWLGQMQGFFARQPEYLTRCDFLIRHDEGFFRSKAELALRDVAQIAPASAPRLAKIVDRYDQAIKVMAAQPRTLVHGGYIPWHILLDMTVEDALWGTG